jgi:hypothetical protein
VNDFEKIQKQLRDVHTRAGAAIVAVCAIFVRDVDPSFGPMWASVGGIVGVIMLLGAMALLWLTEPKS